MGRLAAEDRGSNTETNVGLDRELRVAPVTRLTNAFSKKVENHAAAISLYFMSYDFGRVHRTLRVTPAMRAGVANQVWNVGEIVAVLG